MPSSPTRPTCIQCFTNGAPDTDSLWAASHSWCGIGQVASAAVHVERDAEVAQRDRRTLDVPARAPGTPPRLPGRLVLQRRLPQHEVQRVALVGIVGPTAVDRRELEHRGAVLVTHLTETGELRDLEVDRAVHLVGDAGVEGAPDHREDLRDGAGRAGLAVDRQQVDQQHVAFEAGHLLGREVEVVDAELARLAQHVVVDVGDVANAARLVSGVAQSSLQEVEAEVHVGVAEVRRVVRRDAAAVDGDERAGLEGVHPAASGVVEPHRATDQPSSRSCGSCVGC